MSGSRGMGEGGGAGPPAVGAGAGVGASSLRAPPGVPAPCPGLVLTDAQQAGLLPPA